MSTCTIKNEKNANTSKKMNKIKEQDKCLTHSPGPINRLMIQMGKALSLEYVVKHK